MVRKRQVDYPAPQNLEQRQNGSQKEKRSKERKGYAGSCTFQQKRDSRIACLGHSFPHQVVQDPRPWKIGNLPVASWPLVPSRLATREDVAIRTRLWDQNPPEKQQSSSHHHQYGVQATQ